jgi:hypothetical protein
MTERCLCPDFDLRGQEFEIWSEYGENYLVDPRKREVVNTDRVFTPPLTNDELLRIYGYGRDW